MRRIPALLLLTTFLLTGCVIGGGDDGTVEAADDPAATDPDGTAPKETEQPDVVADACATFAGNVVRIAGEPIRLVPIDELTAVLEALAAEGPAEVRPSADRLVAVMPIAGIESEEEMYALAEELGVEGYKGALADSIAAAEDLVAWAVPICAPDQLAWSCAAPGSPVLAATNVWVGEMPDPDDPMATTTPEDAATDPAADTTEPQPVRATPEDVVAAEEPDGEAVEISRTGDRVEVGWLDRGGLVERVLVAQRQGDGWVLAGDESCTITDE